MQAQNLLDKRKGTTAADRVNRSWLAAYLLQRNQTLMTRLANFYRRIQTHSRQKRRSLCRQRDKAIQTPGPSAG